MHGTGWALLAGLAVLAIGAWLMWERKHCPAGQYYDPLALKCLPAFPVTPAFPAIPTPYCPPSQYYNRFQQKCMDLMPGGPGPCAGACTPGSTCCDPTTAKCVASCPAGTACDPAANVCKKPAMGMAMNGMPTAMGMAPMGMSPSVAMAVGM